MLTAADVLLSQVVLVRWNEPFQKLATCDTDGGIFVWIQYEGRWSVELVNDRGAQVRRPKAPLPFPHELRCLTRCSCAGQRLHLVSRRHAGADLLPRRLRAGGLGERPATLVLRDQPGESDHLWDLDTRRPAGDDICSVTLL